MVQLQELGFIFSLYRRAVAFSKVSIKVLFQKMWCLLWDMD